MIQIYHNSRCGKSRNCLAHIEESKREFEVINYLTNPPSMDELILIIEKLRFKPLDLIRQKEKIWIDNFKDLDLTDLQIIEAMVDNPILIERPIVIMGDKAIIGRELENVSSFLS